MFQYRTGAHLEGRYLMRALRQVSDLEVTVDSIHVHKKSSCYAARGEGVRQL